MGQKKLYSQSEEQLFIDDYFSDKQNGKFLDVGAYDVFRFSNVRSLFEKGWGGILVEPQPANFNGIKEHYKDDKRIEVLNIAIGETSGEIDFYESDGDAVGTTDVEHMKKWGAAGVKYTKIKVPQLSVSDFMHEYCDKVDFISIDTEATNMAVFRAVPEFVWQQIRMLCIEHDNCKQEIEEKLSKYGFNVLYTNAENIILAKP